MLEIRLLGRFEAQLDGAPVEIASRPAQSLLAYLAMHPGVAHRREKLAGIFWPEASDRQARNNLRYTLWQVRKALGGSKADRFIQADKIAVTFLGDSGAWVDAVELGGPEEEAAGTEGLIRSLSLYGGELLPGFYEEWVVLERDRLSGRYDQRINRLLDRLMDEGRWAAVFEWAERWISRGHGPEPAFRALMRAHAALEDAAGLAAAYSRCRESLRQQLGVDPSPATVRLFQELSSAKPLAREIRLPSNEIRTGPPEPSPPEGEVPEFLRAESEIFARRPYAGRETELGRLRAQLDQVVRGSGKVTLVVGEVGKGKTALVEEFARRAEAERPDLLLVSGACDVSTGPGDPYLPFREVLTMLAGDVEPRWAAGSIPREHALRLWRASSITMEALAERAPELISLFLSPNALRVWLERGPRDGRARRARLEEILGRLERAGIVEPPHRNRIFEAYTDVLTALAEAHPLLVFLDDLHWLDPSSASLLVHLARRLDGKRILIVGTYRPEDISPLPDGTDHPLQAILAELKQIYGDIWMDLDRGGEATTRPLVDALVDLEPNELGAEFRDPLAEVTEGNPLFVLELLQHLQEKGDLVQNAAGKWVIARPIDWQVMPVRVEGVIEERMAHLDRELREALVIASVQGGVFIAEAIARVQGVDERALVRRMTRELQDQHRLVSELGVERIGDRRLTQYRFGHILIQRYLEQRLGQSERSYLHEALGKALEDLYADHTARAAHRLARHFAEASLAGKAVFYLEQAGEQALKLSAYQEAIGHLQRAEGMLASLPAQLSAPDRLARAQLERLLGEAYYGLGDIPESRDHLAQAVALLGQPIPRGKRRIVLALAAELVRQSAHRLFPGRRVPASSPVGQARQAAASAYKLLVEVHIAAQEQAPALLASLRALNLAERLGPSPELARAYGDMSVVCPLMGMRWLGEIYRRMAEETADSLGQDGVTAYVLLATSIFLVGEGRWAESEKSLDRAIELYRRLGDWNRLGLALGVRTHVHVFKAEFESFARLHRELEQLALRSGSFVHLTWSRDGQAEALLRQGPRGALGAVVSRLENSLSEMQGKGFEAEETVVHGLLCQAYLRLGRLADAERSADAGARLISKSPPTFYSFLEGVAGPYQGYLAVWEASGAAAPRASKTRRIREARIQLRRFSRSFPLARPRLAILEGLQAWLSGDRLGAQRKWRGALALAHKLQMPREEAQAHFEIARHLETGSPSRRDHLREAGRLFGQMGAAFELEEVNRLAAEEP